MDRARSSSSCARPGTRGSVPARPVPRCTRSPFGPRYPAPTDRPRPPDGKPAYPPRPHRARWPPLGFVGSPPRSAPLRRTGPPGTRRYAPSPLRSGSVRSGPSETDANPNPGRQHRSRTLEGRPVRARRRDEGRSPPRSERSFSATASPSDPADRAIGRYPEGDPRSAPRSHRTRTPRSPRPDPAPGSAGPPPPPSPVSDPLGSGETRTPPSPP